MEELGKSQLTPYEPHDIQSIKKSKYLTEKELEQEALLICEILKDVSKYKFFRLFFQRVIGIKD